jgi:hypothetical protein
LKLWRSKNGYSNINTDNYAYSITNGVTMKEREYTDIFENLCRAKGWSFKRSSKHEDMKLHIDGFVTIYNKGRAVRTFSVDLKGDKYTSRANNGIKDCLCQYIEFLNVQGDRGWLFGKAEYIACLNENQDGFYLIPMKDLIGFCEDLFCVSLKGKVSEIGRLLTSVGCEKNLWTSNVECAMHKLYHRRDRLDEIVTQINMDDIKGLSKMRI